MKSKKIVTICLIVSSVFLYWVASQLIELIFDLLTIAITRDLFLTIPEMLALVGAALAFVFALRSKKIVGFLTEAVTELSKVTYPTRKEAAQSAVVVVVLVGIATMFVAFSDLIWSTLTRWILN